VIRVTLPTHLRTLARVEGEVRLDVPEPATTQALLDRLEELHPVLRGAIRDHVTKQRRAFVRFFACGDDLSLDPVENPLPEQVTKGDEPFRIVGATAGG
jgi:sulfur-carrier protein